MKVHSTSLPQHTSHASLVSAEKNHVGYFLNRQRANNSMTDYGLSPLLHATIVSSECSKQILSMGRSPDSYKMYLVTLSYRITKIQQNLSYTEPGQNPPSAKNRLQWTETNVETERMDKTFIEYIHVFI
jgi:hypothetical protein